MRASLILLVLVAPLVMARDAPQPLLYEIRTSIVMPHLEENLRYASAREQRCLSAADLMRAFPVLEHPALAGCRLVPSGGSMSYVLACPDASGTSGQATWRAGKRHLSGSLHVKLGGKNMTFEQRVTARALGACATRYDRKSRGAAPSDDD
jgi:hypothetical protein